MPILRSDVEPACAVNRRARTHIRFSDEHVITCEVYGNVVYKSPPVEVESSMARVVEDDDYWDLIGIILSKDLGVRTSLSEDVAAIQSWCQDLSIPIPDNASAVYDVSLSGP